MSILYLIYGAYFLLGHSVSICYGPLAFYFVLFYSRWREATPSHINPTFEFASRYGLRSANRHRLIVPCCRLNTYGHPRAFPVAGPTVWNLLPDELRYHRRV